MTILVQKITSAQAAHKQSSTNKLRVSIIRSALALSLIVGTSTMASQTAYADVRDVNRTAGETVDTVMWPAPEKKSKPKPKPETKPLTCGVIFGILLCW